MARGYDFSTAAGAEVEPLEAVGVSYECWRRYRYSTYFVVLGRGVAVGRLDLCVFHGCYLGAASGTGAANARRDERTLPSFVHGCEWTCLRLLARPKTNVIASERAVRFLAASLSCRACGASRSRRRRRAPPRQRPGEDVVNRCYLIIN